MGYTRYRLTPKELKEVMVAQKKGIEEMNTAHERYINRKKRYTAIWCSMAGTLKIECRASNIEEAYSEFAKVLPDGSRISEVVEEQSQPATADSKE